MPANHCMKTSKVARVSISTAPARRYSKSSRNLTCVRQPKQSPMPVRCTALFAGSVSATATCKRARSAVTLTYLCANPDNLLVRVAKSRTSTPFVSCNRLSITKCSGRSMNWKRAAPSSRPPSCLIRTPAKHAQCAPRKTRWIIATSLIQISYLSSSATTGSNVCAPRCRNSRKTCASVSRRSASRLTMLPQSPLH